MASNASMALGGIVWGASATLMDLSFTLHAASISLLISLPLLFRFSIDVVQKLFQKLDVAVDHKRSVDLSLNATKNLPDSNATDLPVMPPEKLFLALLGPSINRCTLTAIPGGERHLHSPLGASAGSQWRFSGETACGTQ